MNIQEALDYIHANSWQRSKPGLTRIEKLLSLLDNPHKKLKFVHIAGTNGKGSTSVITASILAEAGYKTGLFTSPYLHVFNERIRVNGENIPDKELIEAVERVKEVVPQMEELPTEFEIVTAIGFIYFEKCHCDIVVLEVGLGGRLDPTNIIESPEVAVITAIGLDHTMYLGDTVEKIAYEKAGIIKEGCQVVLYPQGKNIMDTVEKIAEDRKAVLHRADFHGLKVKKSDLEGQVFTLDSYEDLELSLLGEYQLNNSAVAIKVIEVLSKKGFKVSEEALRSGLKKAKWPGRFEVLMDKPCFIIDGAHNPQGIEALLANIKRYLPGKKLTFIIGMLKDKAYEEMLDMIIPYGDRFYAVAPFDSRAIFTKELSDLIAARGASKVLEVQDLVEAAEIALNETDPSDAIIAFGSLYIIGDIREYLI
ncbi:MAG: bifunctional folylpolyglutamate synthase/dihydrofolate synthase [Clostridiaceae bacterium]